MKPKGKLDLLHGAGDETLEKITEQAPADWDMDDLFEKSYSKYLAQKNAAAPDELPAEEVTAVVKPAGIRWSGILVTAACMAVAFGTVGTMFYLKRSAPAQQSILETETQTVTATVAETEASTNAPDATDPTQAPTAAVPAAVTLPAETNATAGETTQEQGTAATAAQTTAAATQKPQENQVQTQPAQTGGQKQTDPPETTAPPQTTAPPATTAPPDTQDMPSTQAPWDAVPQATGDADPQSASVFKIRQKNDFLTYTGVGPDVPLSEDMPILNYGNYTIERFSEGDPYSQHYRIQDQDSDALFVLHRFRWSAFYAELNGTVWDQPILGREGYAVDGEIIWDDGGGISLLTFVPENQNTAIAIAEHLEYH